jgi:hypothetical protein
MNHDPTRPTITGTNILTQFGDNSGKNGTTRVLSNKVLTDNEHSVIVKAHQSKLAWTEISSIIRFEDMPSYLTVKFKEKAFLLTIYNSHSPRKFLKISMEFTCFVQTRKSWTVLSLRQIYILSLSFFKINCWSNLIVILLTYVFNYAQLDNDKINILSL